MLDAPAPPETPGRPQHLFIVRMWHEPSRGHGGQWRGSVDHVPSGQRLYFAAIGDLSDFITLRLDSPPLDEPPTARRAGDSGRPSGGDSQRIPNPNPDHIHGGDTA